MGRPIGEAGLALIKQFEGCRLTAYKAVSTEKYWTIGWGHYGPDVEEDRLLESDCQRFADAVDDPKNCPPAKELNSSQRDALISFTFNCGVGRLRTLCKNRSLPEIRDAMALYTRSGGKTLPVLVRRRAAEQALFDIDNPSPLESPKSMEVLRQYEKERAFYQSFLKKLNALT